MTDAATLQQQLVSPTEQHIVIIGSGLVGCELANDYITAGYRVTIVSQESYPMSRLLPPALGQVFARR